MLARGGGAVVNIGSMVGMVGFEYSAAYSASGGGPLISRVAHVDEVAELVLYLAGPRSGSLTGAVIPYDAGFIAH